MADITNLTGYTWKASANTMESNLLDGLSFNINFTSKDNINYTLINFEQEFETFVTTLKYDTTEIYSFEFENEHWIADDNKKEITFTGGADVGNVFLIEFFEDNGTLTKGGTTKNLKLGSENVKMCLGDIEVDKIYLGTELLYEK